jgi:monoamine oxidase
MPHLRAELGGMRIPTNQTLVMALLDELGIETVPFPMGDEHNLRYLRGARFTVADLGNPEIIPYHLPRKLRGKTPGQIIVETAEHFIPHARQLTPAQWAAVRRAGTFHGEPLHDIEFRSLLARDLPEEAVQFVRDATGADVLTQDANAADVLYEIITAAAGNPLVTPRLGMEEIPRALAAAAEQHGATLHRQHRLRRLTSLPDAAPDAPGLRLEVEDVVSGAVKHISARHVILALPPRALALLAPDSLPLTAPSFPVLRDALLPLAASKTFLGYDRPWWRDLGISSGRSICDLPLHVTYYLDAEGDRPGADARDRSALLLASSAEGAAAAYWASFRQQDPATPGSAPFQRPEIGVVPDELALPERAVAELQRQLRLVHGPDVTIGEPTFAVLADWRRDPYGAGYHLWATGASAWRLVPLAREPVPGRNLSLCGEAWSSEQGWSLGALLTAERVVQERLGLPWPAWLPAEVDLGP